MANLWVDGRKLAMTSFKVQHLVGTGWVSGTKYELNQKYRFKACFRSLFSPDIPSNNSACATCDVYMTGFKISLKLPFARFSGSSSDNTMVTLTKVRENSLFYILYDFNDTIKPSASRYFEFGDFTWMGPPTPVANAPVEVRVFHLEVFHAGLPDAGRVIPNLA